MANNRMMIRCRSCGQYIIIAKHFLTPWRTVPNLDDKLTEFFNEHYYCKTRNHYVYHNSFELISEFREGFPSDEDEILAHYYDIYDEDYDKEVAKQNDELKYEMAHSNYIINQYISNEKGAD